MQGRREIAVMSGEQVIDVRGGDVQLIGTVVAEGIRGDLGLRDS